MLRNGELLSGWTDKTSFQPLDLGAFEAPYGFFSRVDGSGHECLGYLLVRAWREFRRAVGAQRTLFGKDKKKTKDRSRSFATLRMTTEGLADRTFGLAETA